MTTYRKRFIWLSVVLALMLAAAGCSSLPFASGPRAPCTVTFSQQAANALLARIQANRVQGKTVTISASSQEVTSLLDVGIQQLQKQDPSTPIPIENPVVCFQNGKMAVFAGINGAGLPKVEGLLTLSASAQDGRLSLHLDDIQLGQFNAPALLGDQISALIDNALNQSFYVVHINTVRIASGQMTVSGVIQ